eukprot:m.182108 g.182108  ORF g.182108 m.182108 type:complete len:304 (+) comp25470_c1_seq2:120-1031(+)
MSKKNTGGDLVQGVMSAYGAMGLSNNSDTLDDLEDQMGDDFGFGFDPDQEDPNVAPTNLPVPAEDQTQRSSDSMVFTFPAQRQLLSKLVIQAVPYSAKVKGDPFASFGTDSKSGGVQQEIPDAPDATTVEIRGLKAASEYCFRLVATNPAGTTCGPPTEPLSTMIYAPKQGAFSGWLVKSADSFQKKTLGRRLSLKGGRPNRRLWVVLGEKSISWLEDVDGKPVEALEFEKIKYITSPSDSVQTDDPIFTIITHKDRSIEFTARSTNPNRSDQEYCKEWIDNLRKAHGQKQSFGSAHNNVSLF